MWQNFLFFMFFRLLNSCFQESEMFISKKHCNKKQNNSATKKQSIISSFCQLTKYKNCWIVEAPIIERSFCKLSIWLGIIYTNFPLATFNKFSTSASSFFFPELLCFIALAVEIEDICYLFQLFLLIKWILHPVNLLS